MAIGDGAVVFATTGQLPTTPSIEFSAIRATEHKVRAFR